MNQYLYSKLVKPRAENPDQQSRELVLNCLLLGLLFLAVAFFLGSLFEFAVMARFYLLYRLLATAIMVGAFTLLYWFARKHQTIASLIIITLLVILASTMFLLWGILTPTGILIFSLAIVMAGILISSRFSLYTALFGSLIFFSVEILKDSSVVTPNLVWMKEPSTMGDVFAFSVLFGILALVSWLFNRQMEQSLKRARRSEVALSRQKDLLEIKVKERTRQLEAAQLDKVQQVYRFAELGRISSALFHDLANHLTNVLLDIEGLGKPERSDIMERIQYDIGYIDDVVQRVRLQLRGQSSSERFSVKKQIEAVVTILNYKIVQSHVKVTVITPKRQVYCVGDITHFRQIIINLVSNALDAMTDNIPAERRRIIIEANATKKDVEIKVTDFGAGIKPALQTKIFEPFYSSKADGTGIGLFIVKQIVERDLKGSLSLTSNRKDGTIFTITLPQVSDGTPD